MEPERPRDLGAQDAFPALEIPRRKLLGMTGEWDARLFPNAYQSGCGRPMSFSTRTAALCPAQPMTDPAGWQPALHE